MLILKFLRNYSTKAYKLKINFRKKIKFWFTFSTFLLVDKIRDMAIVLMKSK